MARRQTRFGPDQAGPGSGVLAGYQRATSPRFTRRSLNASLRDYGLTVADAQGTTDMQKYDMAARAVIRRYRKTHPKPASRRRR